MWDLDAAAGSSNLKWVNQPADATGRATVPKFQLKYFMKSNEPPQGWYIFPLSQYPVKFWPGYCESGKIYHPEVER
jgi:hypothetical protein